MNNLFDDELKVLDDAFSYADELRNGTICDPEKFYQLAVEYRRVLMLLKLKTKMTDRYTLNLYESNLDLADKAHFDALTGIYNRRYLDEELTRVLHTMSRSGGGYLSLLMIDLDYFKDYNDTYGHNLGDFCLKDVATALSSVITRSDDFVARFGGEEFTVVLPNTDENGALQIAEKLLESVRLLAIPHEKSTAADHVTISIGVTTGNVEFFHNGLEYIKVADAALYLSKQNGRNRFTFESLS